MPQDLSQAAGPVLRQSHRTLQLRGSGWTMSGPRQWLDGISGGSWPHAPLARGPGSPLGTDGFSPRADATASVRDDRQAERALTVLTVDASPPGGTGAAAGHRVTHCSLPAPAHVGTARTEAALWTACREERGRWPAPPAPLLCATSPRDSMGCKDVPCPCPPWHLPSPHSSAGGQASSAGTVSPCCPQPTPAGPANFPNPWDVPTTQGRALSSVGCPAGLRLHRGPQAPAGCGKEEPEPASRDTGVTRTPSTSAQPGAKRSGRIRKTDGQRAVLPPGWLGPHPRGPGSSHILPPQPLTQAAVRPQEAGRTEAGPGGCVTGGPVGTPTGLLTARPKQPRGAPCRDGAGARGWGPGLAPWPPTPGPGMSSPSRGQPSGHFRPQFSPEGCGLGSVLAPCGGVGCSPGAVCLRDQRLCPLGGVTYPDHSRAPWSLVGSDTPQ